jgi:hypothetical protein
MATREEMIRALRRQDMINALKLSDANEAPEADRVSDSMPEWLNTDDRMVVKNLANNPQESIKYLQGKYPDAEFKTSGDEIIARKRGETTYGKLDPSSFSPSELWNDTKDLAYDAAQVGAEAGGAALGTMALPGWGTAAGAGLGAGAASSAKEALRKHFGIADEMSGTDIAKDAALAAVLPKALQVAGKGIMKGATKLAPSLYAKATGLTTGSLKRIAEKGDDIAKWNEKDALGSIEGLQGDINKWVTGKKAEFAEKYKKIRGGSGDVSLSGVKQEIDQAIAVADEQFNRTGIAAFKDQADQLKRMKDEVIGGSAKDTLGISDAMDLDQRLSNDWIDYADDVGLGVGQGRSVSQEQQKLAKALRERLRGDINQSSYGSLQNTADEYSGFVDQINFLRKNFKDPKKIQSTLEGLNKGKDINLLGSFQSLDPKLIQAIEQAKGDIDLYRYFKPMNNSILTEEGLKDLTVGKTPIEKLLTALGTGAGYVSGGAVGGVVGAGAGRVAGKAVASPRSVKAVAKAGKKVGAKMESLEKLIRDNPALQNLLYGSAYATSSK